MRRRLKLELNGEVHAVYLRTFVKPMRYNIWYGGKWTGKTYAISLAILIKQLLSGDKDILVLRKYNKDHTSSTFKTIKKAISHLDKIMECKGHNHLSNWKFKQSPSIEVEYIPTKAKIYFAGMDDPGRVAGITTDDVDRMIGIVWYEEPIEVADMKSISKLEQQILAKINFEVVEDSALRPPVSKEDSLVEIHFTMNSWKLLTSWIYEKFYKLFKRIDYSSEELLHDLETKGYYIVEDPSFMDGQGARVVHTSFMLLKSMGVLPKTQIAKHKLRKIFAPAEYKLISLGIPEEDESFVMKKYKKDIRREVDTKTCRPHFGGLDIAQLNDSTVVEVMWDKRVWDKKSNSYKWEYDDIIYKGELVIKNPSLKEQSRLIIEWILDNFTSQYPEMVDYGFTFLVHKEADFKIYEPFLEMKSIIEGERGISLKWMNMVAAPKPNVIKNRIGARVSMWLQSCRWRKLIIAKENKVLYKTLLDTEVDRNGKRIEDKRMLDALNAAEHPLTYTFARRRNTWMNLAKQKSLLNEYNRKILGEEE